MFSPTVCHIPWKTGVEPVKWMPARCSLARAGSPTAAPEPWTRLITPGGRPASSNSFIRKCALTAAVEAGFQTTVLPISATEVGGVPAVEVEVDGGTAKTEPSRGRYSRRGPTPCEGGARFLEAR